MEALDRTQIGQRREEHKVFLFAPIAQMVEQLTLNQWVAGSSPAGGTLTVYMMVKIVIGKLTN